LTEAKSDKSKTDAAAVRAAKKAAEEAEEERAAKELRTRRTQQLEKGYVTDSVKFGSRAVERQEK
jgi:hypothetical protein